MVLCSVCNENLAVVFITKLVEGKQTQEGLCLSCARKRGIGPINQLLEQSGLSEEDIEDLNKQVSTFFENIDINDLNNSMVSFNDSNSKNNVYFNQLNKNSAKNDKHEDFNNTERKTDEGSNRHENKDNSVRTKTQERKSPPKKKKYLDTYGINLTERAYDKKIDMVIGRQKEIDRTIQILNRRTKNNPMLIGEPGVGKTAIAEGLAVKIIEKKVPVKFFNTEVYMLDLTGVIAGTQFRGQFEGRMKGIIEETIALGNVILIIDEIHNVMGAGEAEGALSAASILKPALTRGEIQVIGTTTLNEYRKHIEKDQAFERRFMPIIVDEPTVDETIEILKGIRDHYENFHKVKISDEVIKAVTILSKRYITNRFLPDKAIDILDEAGAKANLKNTTLFDLQHLKNELRLVQDEKENAISADSIEDYQKASDLKIRECKLIQSILELEKNYLDTVLTVEDIANVISSWTKIPVSSITEEEAFRLLN